MTRRPALALALLLSTASAARAEDAQVPGVAHDHFEPAPAGDAFVSVPSATVPGLLFPSAALTIGYAHAPLVLDDGSAVIGDELVLHAQASLEILGRTKLDIDAPVTLFAGGDDPTVGQTRLPAPGAFLPRDIRLTARVAIFSQKLLLPTIAANLSVWLPSGDPASYASTGFARFAPGVVVGGDHHVFVYGLSASLHFEDGRSPLESEARFGAAAALRIWKLSLGAELFGAVTLGRPDNPLDLATLLTPTSSFEALASARLRLGPLVVSAAVGPGLSQGRGTPAFRAIGSVTFDPDLGPLGRGSAAPH